MKEVLKYIYANGIKPALNMALLLALLVGFGFVIVAPIFGIGVLVDSHSGWFALLFFLYFIVISVVCSEYQKHSKKADTE